jgi:hypothetical protein
MEEQSPATFGADAASSSPTDSATPDSSPTPEGADSNTDRRGRTAVPLPENPVDITWEDVKAANDVRFKIVAVPEWKPNGVVYVYMPSIGAKNEFEAAIATGKNPDGSPKRLGSDAITASLVAMAACNSKGDRIFSPDHIEWLKKKSIAPMERIYDAMIELAIITPGDVDTMAKNSGAAS